MSRNVSIIDEYLLYDAKLEKFITMVRTAILSRSSYRLCKQYVAEKVTTMYFFF